MSDYLIDDLHFSTDDISLNVEALSAEAIALSDDQINQARGLSQRVIDEKNRWQAYLNALALTGFEEWLHQRTTDISLNSQFSKIVQSSTAHGATAICNIIANDFKLCIIGVGSMVNAEIAIPTAAIDLVSDLSHFYVPIKVYEELGQVLIAGFLSYEQLKQYQQTHKLKAAPDHTYRLSLSWFEPNTDRLLLQLSCTTPAAISQPISKSSSTSSVRNLFLRQTFLEPVVNASTWIQHQWDHLAESVGWQLLPSMPLMTAMRSPGDVVGVRSRSVTEEFRALLKDLESHNIFVAEDAGSAYRDFMLGEIPLRLYAVITQKNPPNTPSEWSLLLILKTQDDTKLPLKIQLQVSDMHHEIVAQLTNQQADAGYLFTRVIGCHHEQFLVTLSLPTGESLTLPPFVFRV